MGRTGGRRVGALCRAVCDQMKGTGTFGTWGTAGSGVGAGCMELRVGGPKADMGRDSVTVGCMQVGFGRTRGAARSRSPEQGRKICF